MAKPDANIIKIRRKTHLTFIISFLIMLAVSFFVAYFTYNRSVYHIQFFGQYISSATFRFFCQSIFFVAMTATVFCYSLIVGRGDIITKSGKRLMFHQVVSTGVVILAVLTVVNILAQEVLIPGFDSKLDLLSNSTLRANTALRTANHYYEIEDYEKSIKYYQEYLSIIDDSSIDERLREVKNKINIPKAISNTKFNNLLSSLSRSSDASFLSDIYQHQVNGVHYINSNISDAERSRVWSILNEIDFFGGDYTPEGQIRHSYTTDRVSDKISDYAELADIYFDRHDYLTAWYYYQYVVEMHISKSRFAQDRIAKIKTFLRDQYGDMSDSDFDMFIRETEQNISNIYNLKNKAATYLETNQYQKAFFTFSDILRINGNLRDAIQGQNQSLNMMASVGVNYNEIMQMKNYIGKDNFVFNLNDHQVMSIGTITKVYDMNTLRNNYYLYDIQITEYDDYHNVISVTESEYGQIKNGITCTLYCYNPVDRQDEHFPIKRQYNINGKVISEQTVTDNFIYNLPISIDMLYNFSQDYDKILAYPLTKLIRLNRINKTDAFLPNVTRYEYEVIWQNVLSRDDFNIVSEAYYYNEKNMIYSIRRDATKLQISNATDRLVDADIINQTPNIGFERKSIKMAIYDKISRMFLFIVLGLSLITLAWRTKADYIGMIPAAELPALILIPTFIYILIKVLCNFITTVMSTLCNLIVSAANPEVTFRLVLVGIVAFWIVLLVGAVILLACNKAE